MRSRRQLTLARIAVVAAMVAGVAALAPATASAAKPDRYVVVLRSDVSSAAAVAREHAVRHGAEVLFVYEHSIKGYAARIPQNRVDNVRRDRRVLFVERDQRVRAFSHLAPTGIKRTFATTNGNLDIDDSDDLRVDADVAVLDTGIDYDHPDLNVVARTDCTGGGPFKASCTDDSGDDGNGHGSHVAGSAAAVDNGFGVVGMAPGARLYAVKVLGNDGSGWISQIVAGVDWVTARAGTIEAANMSLGCECSSDSLDAAISKSADKGVVYAVAAGNSDADAATHSPANHPDVITVSALADFDGVPGGLGSPNPCRDDQDDTLADFSNWGSSIEIAAPGVCIYSTYKNGEYYTASGTSMASPHAVGAAAILASMSKPTDKPGVYALRDKLEAEGNYNWTDDSGTDDSGDGVKEPLLDVSDTTVFAPPMVPGSDGSTTNSPPTASFTFGCSSLTCSFDGSGSTDSDGTIQSYGWDFGDGATASGATVSHTYAAAGTYTVTLTVTDNAGATDTESKQVSVAEITLTATGFKEKGLQKAELQWSGAEGSHVVLSRNGESLGSIENDGYHIDHIDQRGGGSYTYKVCEDPTKVTDAGCSNEATVTF